MRLAAEPHAGPTGASAMASAMASACTIRDPAVNIWLGLFSINLWNEPTEDPESDLTKEISPVLVI